MGNGMMQRRLQKSFNNDTSKRKEFMEALLVGEAFD
jgi:hypothetical protein